MRKKLISFLLIFALLLPCFAFAVGTVSIDYHIDGNKVSITVKGESYRPISILIEDGSRKYYIDQKETDASGKAVFNTSLEKGKEYNCIVNIDGIRKNETITVKEDDPDEPKPPEKPNVAYIYIKGYKGVILSETEVNINKGDTVLSLTKSVLSSEGIDYTIRSGYVAGIDDQNEFDKGSESGWVFSINGGFPSVGAGSVNVRSGDYIEWLYTTNLGKDVGNIFTDPKKDVIDNALALLDDKTAGEKEITKMIKDIADYIVDSVENIKSKDDLKTVLKDFKDINTIFLKASKRLETEDGFNNAAVNSLNMGEIAAKLLNHAEDEATINQIFTIVKESTGITLALVNKMSNQSRIEKIVDDMLNSSIEFNKKLFAKQPDSNIKSEQRFFVIIPQDDKDSVEISLPAILLSRGLEKGITKLDLSSEILNTGIPLDALNETQKKQGFKLSAKKADRSVLPKTVQDQIPDGSIIIDITEGSKQEFNKPIEAGIPFTGTYNSEEAVTVFLLDDNGKTQPLGGIYDPTVKKVRFFTAHFSKYFAKEFTVDFMDIGNHWAKKEIGILAGKGIIKGKKDRLFEPDVNITRAEFTALITRLLGYGENDQYTIPFTDVTKNDWYYNQIAIAYNNGLVNGKSIKEFEPNGNITRQEMIKIISNILENKFYKQENLEDLKKFKDFAEIATWAQESAALCLREKIISGVGEGKFAPRDNATRAQVATILYRIYGLCLH